MTTFSFKGISERRKAQLRLISGLHTQLFNALDEEWRTRKLTRRKIADILGWDKAALTRKLKSSANITVATLADLSFALNRETLLFLVPSYKAQTIKHIVLLVLQDKVIQVGNADGDKRVVRLADSTVHHQQHRALHDEMASASLPWQAGSSELTSTATVEQVRQVA